MPLAWHPIKISYNISFLAPNSISCWVEVRSSFELSVSPIHTEAAHQLRTYSTGITDIACWMSIPWRWNAVSYIRYNHNFRRRVDGATRIFMTKWSQKLVKFNQPPCLKKALSWQSCEASPWKTSHLWSTHTRFSCRTCSVLTIGLRYAVPIQTFEQPQAHIVMVLSTLKYQ